MGGPACLRGKKSVLVNRLLVCMIFIKWDATWRVFVSCLGQLFIVFTITTSKPLGFYMLTESSFTSFAVFWLHFAKFLISSSVANSSVCVRSNIVWNRWKSALRPKPRNKNVKKWNKTVNAVYFYLSAQKLAYICKYSCCQQFRIERIMHVKYMLFQIYF